MSETADTTRQGSIDETGPAPNAASPAGRHGGVIARWLLTLARRVVTMVVVLAIMIGLWQATVSVFGLPPIELPPPADVWDLITGNFGLLVSESKPTIIESVIGYLIAAVLGVPLGLLLARPGRVGAMLNTGALTAQIFPKICVAPLFIVWFGFGFAPKILFVFLLSFFPIAINAAAGFASMPLDLQDLGSIIGMGPLAKLRRLQGPWALPQIFTGLKISASFAIIAAIVAEFVGANHGLGVLISQTQANLNVALMFAGIIAVTLLGFVFYGLVALVEIVSIPWHVSRRRS